MRVLLSYLGMALLSTFSVVYAADDVILLDDDFSTYRSGLFSSTVGAHTEYHYLPEAARKGNWGSIRISDPAYRHSEPGVSLSTKAKPRWRSSTTINTPFIIP